MPAAKNQEGKGFFIFATPKVGGERRIVLFRSVDLFRNRARHAVRSWGDLGGHSVLGGQALLLRPAPGTREAFLG